MSLQGAPFSEMLLQESLDGTVEVEYVFLVGETVAFVVFHHVFHFRVVGGRPPFGRFRPC